MTVSVPYQHDFGAPPLEVVVFASAESDLEDPELSSSIATCDLVLALGNVDLDRLALAIGPDKPALCVLGGQDPQRQPPAPFRALHGNGVEFNGWRIAGLSGSPTDVAAPADTGARISEGDAGALMGALPACDILITHAPPAGEATPAGLRAVADYLLREPPIFHFYAAQADHQAFTLDPTLIVGVYGVLVPPTLVYA